MSNHVSDGQIDRLVKAQWLALGLSQSDLAEVLGAFIQETEDRSGSGPLDPERASAIAEALEVPHEQAGGDVLQSLLDLRLLRAFHRLTDQRTKLMLVHLTEQMVKRQQGRNG